MRRRHDGAHNRGTMRLVDTVDAGEGLDVVLAGGSGRNAIRGVP
jgi:hypothetical protein